MSKKERRKKRRQPSASPQDTFRNRVPANPSASVSLPSISSSLRIAVAAAPRPDISLDVEVRLVKAALLYADEVTLYSPTATLAATYAGLATFTRVQQLELLRQTAPALLDDGGREFLANWARFQQMKRSRGKSKDEIRAIMEFESGLLREMDRMWHAEFVPLIGQLMESSGASQLVRAIEAGLLKISPLIEGDGDHSTDAIVDAFVAKLGEVLGGSDYPLFDDPTGELVRSGIAEGMFRPRLMSEDRGKQAALASSLLGTLPAFPAASVDEVLGIRDELRPQLERFRSAMIDFARLIKAPAYDADFPDYVEQVYREKVVPALAEIEEATRASGFMRMVLGELANDAKGLFLGGTVAVGLVEGANLSAFVSGAAAAATPILYASAKAAWERHERQETIGDHEMFFLYRTDQLLSDGE